jgi:polysaccharide biosynthesis protein PslH
VVPYAPTAIRTRPYNFLRSLVERGHAVTLATLWETETEQTSLAKLTSLGVEVFCEPLSRLQIARNALRGLWRDAPLQAHYCWQPRLWTGISRLLRQGPRPYDVVHVEHLRGAAYGQLVADELRRVGHSTALIWDSVDCISLLFEQAMRYSLSGFGRWITRLELPRTRRYERTLVRFFAGVITTSAKDKAALEALAAISDGDDGPADSRTAASEVTVVPNGVDDNYFTPASSPSSSTDLILTGKMSYHANVTAALRLVNDIMPLVWQRHPLTKVIIAGSTPAPAIRRLVAQHGTRVVVTGYVPDLRPFLWKAGVAVAPVTYGAGIQNKVLEAMACGLPVVASSQASSALQAKPGQDLLVADTPSDFAASILQLLDAPAKRKQLGCAGREYVLRRHRWDQIVAKLEMLYQARARQLN